MTKIKFENPKRVVFFRHGHSLNTAQAKTGDSQRPLSERGADEVKSSVQKLLQLKINFDIILSSTHERAEQTSRILSEILNVKILSEKSLCGDLTPLQIWQFLLNSLKTFNNVIVVGHQPHLGIIAGELLYGAAVPLATANFITIEFKDYLPLELNQGFASEVKYG
jgi:phosphohistidine phosphatase SixA